MILILAALVALPSLGCAPLPFAVEKITEQGGTIVTVLRVPNTPSGSVLVYEMDGQVFVSAMLSRDCVVFESYGVGPFVPEVGV